MNNGYKEIARGIYQISYYYLGIADVYMYLIVGEDKALLIDTGYSVTKVQQYVSQITDRPAIVVNTHGHFDHIGGNAYFNQAFLSKADWQLAKKQSDHQTLQLMIERIIRLNRIPKVLLEDPSLREELDQSIRISAFKTLDLPDCGYFDLGNRKVRFMEAPGHTKGSIILFDEQSEILFTGDNICNKGVLLAFEESVSVEEYLKTLKKIKKFCLENDVKTLYPSHHEVDLPVKIIDGYIEICRLILGGKEEGVYKDNGTCAGYIVQKSSLSLLYRKDDDRKKKKADEKIYDSFTALLRKKPFDDISVEDIIYESGVSRATFYRQFEDKYALLNDTLIYATDKYVNSDRYTLDQWKPFLEDFLSQISHSRSSLNFYHHSSREQMYTVYSHYFGEMLNKRLRECGISDPTPYYNDISILASILSTGLIDWIKSDFRTDKKQLIDDLLRFVPEDLRKLLKLN